MVASLVDCVKVRRLHPSWPAPQRSEWKLRSPRLIDIAATYGGWALWIRQDRSLHRVWCALSVRYSQIWMAATTATARQGAQTRTGSGLNKDAVALIAPRDVTTEGPMSCRLAAMLL